MTGTASRIIRAAPTASARPWPRHVLSSERWTEMVAALPDEPSLTLIGLWGDKAQIHALFMDDALGVPLPASVPVEAGIYAAISPHRPAAAWFERMIADLWGYEAAHAVDTRPWLDHGRWPHHHPLSLRPVPASVAPEPPEFLPATPDTLHQVAVGPIHAGIIEPGHFRFTAAGETVVRLETRLGYTHKGVLRMVVGQTPQAASRFAARLSGDATVAHALAFAHAVEAACGVQVSPRAQILRAIMAELERIANHLGDIGAICGDTGFAAAPAAFQPLREWVLRAAHTVFGHRLMMDKVVPGGVSVDMPLDGPAHIHQALSKIETALPPLATMLDRASLADRLHGTGITTSDILRRFAPGGVIGRAGGRAADARRVPGYPPYRDPPIAIRNEGDVEARLRVRLQEVTDSIAMLRGWLDDLPAGEIQMDLPSIAGEGFGVTESFRGDVWHWVRLEAGLVSAFFPRDPSWLQWPVLEAAIHGNIIADFPLINKSFNCSYSGVDL